jgi:AAA domain
MTMLKKAENKMAYAKIGIYGDAKSGKTVTAALIAIGLYKFAKLTKPIGMFDTEPGASFIIPLFQKAGIEFYVYDQSRALVDLMAFMREAEETCSIAIMDSITHTWRDVQESYLRKINATRAEKHKAPLVKLEFHHWNHIKPEWGKFTNLYLSSRLHCIVCGRAGSIYEYQENAETGKKELITIGTKMATEKELGYEPSLLIEMLKHREDSRIINRASVEGDRSMNYNGLEFDFPDAGLKKWLAAPDTLPQPFQTFIKHLEALNLGGEHFGSMTTRDSTELFTEEGDDTWSHEKRQREIWCEEVKALLVEHDLDGTASETKKRRGKLLKDVFQVGSWTAIENMKSEAIKDGFIRMKAILGAPVVDAEQEAGLNAATDPLAKAVESLGEARQAKTQ